MINLRGPDGEPVFESIAITLVCDKCLKGEHPEQCRHKLGEAPRWISSQKVEVVRTLLSEDPAMLCAARCCQTTPKALHCLECVLVVGLFSVLSETNFLRFLAFALSLRETLGISADGSEKLYRNDEIEAFEARAGTSLVWHDRDHRKNVEHVFIAVDPSGGGPSAFSIASALITETGFINVRTHAHTHTQAPLSLSLA